MVTLQLLKTEDAKALLEFELVNQEWFESYIEARDEDFFSEEGIKDHIDFYLSEYEQDRIYPMLLKNAQGTICGRANLYNINREKESGFIGYRIGEEFISQGLATYATEVLINVARDTLALSELIATATTDNLASQRVLSKNGFKQVGFKPEFTIVDGEIIDCYEYRCVIKQLSGVM
ncbi:GNAT family N-acetyltransferase [Aliivibrio sp. S4TY2]|uniref:GNAT family N-acetyltransferase n=1 Tax=unclassified Aliivibrio TaxID=2645654 RepID=UPI002378133A|nr:MULTISPECIES: GNAT family N-acetyltransferase [unclassified Aliivibrio]MDD9155667.1 GNAT family N-acetyltransferase [Aliivibrio sp. S4TY2]MDD9160534.1 GNAT family N-acetyltransferase [Aliivibrio sp. S4TY1]MDD9164568.1 GNAT family N-acetyltransferase [Aliivibrio sp. S4MY2]MDD9168374.1 GNAT family N-acetyltransferase [Aliivibrio sp. S4MY4]MDD9184902.1 GNAT family N-acetyltransferase [Aliivibrio sp. S4MY3]